MRGKKSVDFNSYFEPRLVGALKTVFAETNMPTLVNNNQQRKSVVVQLVA
jgi:hypothetical protein